MTSQNPTNTMLPRFPILGLTVALLLLSPGVLYTAPAPGITTVTVSIPGIQTSNSTLVATPILRITALDISSGGTRAYAPGKPTIDGHIVIERNWSASSLDWADWFEDAHQGQDVVKDVTLSYGTGSPVMLWLRCIPAGYQILPGTTTTAVRERLTLLPTALSPN